MTGSRPGNEGQRERVEEETREDVVDVVRLFGTCVSMWTPVAPSDCGLWVKSVCWSQGH